MSTVLIVGASRGIGAATMARYLRAGDRVAATHRGSGIAVPEGYDADQALAVQCDVTDSASVDAAFDKVEAAFGETPEIVVVNAGRTADQLLVRMDDETWDATLDTNLSGAFRVVRRAARPMMRARRGSIVLVSSVSGAVGAAGQVNYSASKAGLVGIARSTVRELGARNVRVNVVAPGPTDTDMTAALPETQRESLRALVPLGRYGTADEVAQVIEFVSKASFMAGAVVPVDGGAGMGL